ncbi:MAG TPA: endonuclease [Thiothrix sp.]|nr:endonuclease [Thiothrix sp.]
MLGKIFADLYKAYGDQQWWSNYTPFEAMLAALLAQQTHLSYSKAALEQLKHHQALHPKTINKTTATQLAIWLNVANTPNIISAELVVKKAKQVKHYSQWYIKQGGFKELKKLDILTLRNTLLNINDSGIDKETADLILLYAFERPVFIIDEDTRRIFYRLGLINGDEPHDELRHLMTLFLDEDVELFNEFHALLAHHAIEHCREEPHCKNCPLDALCPE